MNFDERPAATMKLIGGRLCLDFVNTAGGRRSESGGRKGEEVQVVRDDKLNDYFDLLAWGLHVGAIDEKQARSLVREAKRRDEGAAAALARAKELREAIHRIFRATIQRTRLRDEDVELLNKELACARNHERLAVINGEFVWQWDEGRGSLDRILWPVVWSAAELLTTGDLLRLRECGGEDCGWLFEDTSRNRSRQWCDMQDCGNLAKVRRFRTRLREAPGKRR